MMMTKFGFKVVNSTKMAGSVITSTDKEDGVEAWHLYTVTDITPNVMNKEPLGPLSMELWQVKSSKLTDVIITIYHPPYLDVNPVTTSMFIDDFTDWIGERVMTYDNIIITGDFNLHVNEVDDPEIQVFNNTITALGF